MNTVSKPMRLAVLAFSLMLLAGYVSFSQSRGRDEAVKAKEEFMMPSSKVLTQPVFSTRKTHVEAEAAVQVFPVIPDSHESKTTGSGMP